MPLVFLSILANPSQVFYDFHILFVQSSITYLLDTFLLVEAENKKKLKILNIMRWLTEQYLVLYRRVIG
jgi:hypothetical protein